VRPLHALDRRRRAPRRSLRHQRLPVAGERHAAALQRLPGRAGPRRRRRPAGEAADVGAEDARRQGAGADQRPRRDRRHASAVRLVDRRRGRALPGAGRRLVRVAARGAAGPAAGALPSPRRRRRAVRLRRPARARLRGHPDHDAQRGLRSPARPHARGARRRRRRSGLAGSRHERRGRRGPPGATRRRARQRRARQRARQPRRRRGRGAPGGRAHPLL
ncbi:MAG: hypothetical protein AVDCRST_MAG38-2405, partial [uncultured Solirubrobacteraceae bacterium]